MHVPELGARGEGLRRPQTSVAVAQEDGNRVAATSRGDVERPVPIDVADGEGARGDARGKPKRVARTSRLRCREGPRRPTGRQFRQVQVAVAVEVARRQGAERHRRVRERREDGELKRPVAVAGEESDVAVAEARDEVHGVARVEETADQGVTVVRHGRHRLCRLEGPVRVSQEEGDGAEIVVRFAEGGDVRQPVAVEVRHDHLIGRKARHPVLRCGDERIGGARDGQGGSREREQDEQTHEGASGTGRHVCSLSRQMGPTRRRSHEQPESLRRTTMEEPGNGTRLSAPVDLSFLARMG